MALTVSTLRIITLLLVMAGACDDKNPAATPAQPGGGPTTLAEISGCLPDCLKKLFEPCQPQGACTSEISGSTQPGATAMSEGWFCFDNGIRVHLSRTFSQALETSTRVVENRGELCRTVESRQSREAGGLYTVKDGMGREVVNIRTAIADQAVTVTCGGTNYTLDGKTPCGASAVLWLAPELPMALSCTTGSCKDRP